MSSGWHAEGKDLGRDGGRPSQVGSIDDVEWEAVDGELHLARSWGQRGWSELQHGHSWQVGGERALVAPPLDLNLNPTALHPDPEGRDPVRRVQRPHPDQDPVLIARTGIAEALHDGPRGVGPIQGDGRSLGHVLDRDEVDPCERRIEGSDVPHSVVTVAASFGTGPPMIGGTALLTP